MIIYLKKKLYDEILKMGEDPNKFVNGATSRAVDVWQEKKRIDEHMSEDDIRKDVKLRQRLLTDKEREFERKEKALEKREEKVKEIEKTINPKEEKEEEYY